MLMSEIIFLKNNIILMHFQVKNNYYYTRKHPLTTLLVWTLVSFFFVV